MGGSSSSGFRAGLWSTQGNLLSHRGVVLSESEVEPDGEHNITELPQAVAGRGNMQAQQSAVRLTEVRNSSWRLLQTQPSILRPA